MAAVHYNRAEKTLAFHAELDLNHLDHAIRRLRRLLVFGLASGVLLVSPVTETTQPEPPIDSSTGPFILPTIIEIANLTGEAIPTPAFPTYAPVPQSFIDHRQAPQQPEVPPPATPPLLPTVMQLAGVEPLSDAEMFQRAPGDLGE